MLRLAFQLRLLPLTMKSDFAMVFQQNGAFICKDDIVKLLIVLKTFLREFQALDPFWFLTQLFGCRTDPAKSSSKLLYLLLRELLSKSFVNASG